MAATNSAWHWQERFESVDVEDACRRQILKIRRSKSYDHWLKEKIRTSRESRTEEPKDDGNQHTQAEIDAAFRDFLRRKRKQTKNVENQAMLKQEMNDAQSKPRCKAPSLHVNPTIKKGSSRKAEYTAAVRRERTETECQEVYEAWLARVRLEDQAKLAQRRDELDRLEKQQRDKHKVTWRKKLAVCAYSTLA
ncbi:hypothetical protein PHMEG_0002716 [Phytophthora megakarya]|uniref:Uncharacterized protein n=1 Tax=Phytophthora megakarya TaxID=4795 RepID=A0A225WYF3_9STRA|nr:hypothetical protein PHMEG_0002716 [Phytophthora megakarya]